jgi:nickel-dependent lactate racemase
MLMETVVGGGSFDLPMTEPEIRKICASSLGQFPLKGKRLLVLIPDHTRHAPIDLFFRIIFELVGEQVASIDYLIATGTHASMDEERIYARVGITREQHGTRYSKVRFFNHEHENPAALETLGTLSGEELSKLTNGLFSKPINITINRMVTEYDHVLIVSPVVPHEAMGFAGGNKYFFPGIAGLEVIQTFHWVAALITNPAINGVKDTPTRRIIDRAVELIKTPRTCFAFTVDDHERVMCLFAGEPREAWSRAADYSSKLHIRYVAKPYKTILGITPAIYEEIWVGGKAMYKLEPIVADGGELIIYGPQIREISFVHGELIRQIGYHCIEYFVRQWDRFSDYPKLIMAHSSNVRGVGTYDKGVERPRVNVTLATSIPESVCTSVNLGYRDPRSIDLDEWRARQNGDVLVVENAGQDLYRLKD